MKKYNISIWNKERNKGLFRSDKEVVFLSFSLLKRNRYIVQNDVDNFVMSLGMDPAPYDNEFVTNWVAFSSNKNYDLSFFYVDGVNSIFMSIISNNKNAKKKLDLLLNKLENLKMDDELSLS